MSSKLIEHYRVDPNAVKNSASWFDKEVNLLKKGGITPNKVMQNSFGKKVSGISPGKMYFYYYDPIGKATLPYYDRFPLCLPYASDSTHFMGLNLHYMPPKLRFQMFDALMKEVGVHTITDKSLMKYRWNIIQSVAKLGPAQHCIKKYLHSQVKSQFIEVPPDKWHTAMMLPVQRFEGMGEQAAWKAGRR